MHSYLEKRYPQLFFLLQMAGKSPQLMRFKNVHKNLNNLDALYLFGLDQGELYLELKPWLEEDKKRRLIIVLPDLAVLAGLENHPLIIDPQVELRGAFENASLQTLSYDLAFAFPFKRIEVISLEKTAKSRRFTYLIKRATTLSQALFNEEYLYHGIVQNLVSNFKKLEGCFYVNNQEGAFKGIPAICCGAGPSLDELILQLKKCQNQTLIIAGGSAITALTNRGIEPHIGMAIDPNFEEYERLKENRANQMPLIFGGRLNHRVLEQFQGPKGYFRSFTGGPIEHWIEEQIGLKEGPISEVINFDALSITTSSISLAAFLGCSPIYLAGIDLAYTNLNRYAKGVMKTSSVELKRLKDDSRVSESYLYRLGLEKKRVHTNVKWVMEKNWVDAFSKNHKKIEMINLSKKGLGFKNVPQGELRRHPERGDLKGYVKEILLSRKLQNLKMDEALQDLRKSFQRASELVLKMEEDQKRAFLYEMDLEDELCYSLALQNYQKRLEYKLKLEGVDTDPKSHPDYYPALKKVISDYLQIFDKNDSESQ
ncbi:MAG: 6-hydroxymethylpterin diphosphokinase MptE-like protein [Simkaniaceae bacterium]